MMRTCVNPACREKFRPAHEGHIWHSEQCYSWVLRGEIGISAAGMRPLGFMGDGNKIRAFNKKWDKIARAAK